MILLDVSDAILCKTFPTTLGDTAQRWHNGLKAGSIANLRQLNREFVIRFFTNIPPKRSTKEIYRCKQGEGKTLRAYIERFNNEAVKIEDLNNDTLVQALKKGTRIRVLGDKLSSKKPKTYQEVMAVAQKYINIDDGRRQKTNDAPREERRGAPLKDNLHTH
ncbi:uncharacterized protein LOC126668561 [Mercurialis annua]|uniref:uncharacterized protein LOC126668561 n=1 Tax=Mercurialis annua TaxID=3986 RepID=UPI00216080B7|nr:uncharacterized protein LOC126668561 [Mercurialis annua]